MLNFALWTRLAIGFAAVLTLAACPGQNPNKTQGKHHPSRFAGVFISESSNDYVQLVSLTYEGLKISSHVVAYQLPVSSFVDGLQTTLEMGDGGSIEGYILEGDEIHGGNHLGDSLIASITFILESTDAVRFEIHQKDQRTGEIINSTSGRLVRADQAQVLQYLSQISARYHALYDTPPAKAFNLVDGKFLPVDDLFCRRYTLNSCEDLFQIGFLPEPGKDKKRLNSPKKEELGTPPAPVRPPTRNRGVRPRAKSDDLAKNVALFNVALQDLLIELNPYQEIVSNCDYKLGKRFSYDEYTEILEGLNEAAQEEKFWKARSETIEKCWSELNSKAHRITRVIDKSLILKNHTVFLFRSTLNQNYLIQDTVITKDLKRLAKTGEQSFSAILEVNENIEFIYNKISDLRGTFFWERDWSTEMRKRELDKLSNTVRSWVEILKVNHDPSQVFISEDADVVLRTLISL